MSGFELLLHICGGVALLLWATRMVRTGIERAFGTALRNVLGYAARNRITAFGTGLGVAAALQSSTATALLAVALVSKGLLQTSPALALMLGADLGSTMVVQALSFDIAWLSPGLILTGVVLFLSTEGRRTRQLGRIIIGLGLMLLSLQLISMASAPLRDSPTLRTILAPLDNDPLLALLIAAVLTWLAHSSVAMVLLIMSFASIGLIPIHLALVLVLGANVGSGLIPVALTMGGERAARRIPLGNFLFRLGGALLALWLVETTLQWFSTMGTDPARQIANFHTLFNLSMGLLFLPLTPLMARLTERLLPDIPDPVDPDGIRFTSPSHLDQELIDQPKQALGCATRETLRMAEVVETMLHNVMDMFEADSKKTVAQLAKMDDEIDSLNRDIKLYLTRLSRNQLSDDESQRCMEITAFTIKLEQIGDIIEKNLLELARKKIGKKLTFSEEGWRELNDMHARVVDNMRLAVNVFLTGDVDSARQLLEAKQRIGHLELDSSTRHLARLRDGQLASIETSAIHLDVLRDLKQINSHLTSVAYPILQQSGQLYSSRLKRRGIE